MSVKKLHDEKLDQLLSDALCKYTHPMPADFTDRMLTQIRQQQERKILAQVILKERLALAACILLAVGSGFAMIAFTQIPVRVIESMKIIANEIPIVIQAVIGTWQLQAGFAAILGFAAYTFFNGFSADYRT